MDAVTVVTCRSKPKAILKTTTICNCTDCHRMSGAPLRAVVMTRPGTFVLLSGEPTEYLKTADSGAVRPQGFARAAGAAIYSTSVGDDQRSTTSESVPCQPTERVSTAPATVCSLATVVDQQPHSNPEIRQNASAVTRPVDVNW